MESNMSHAEKLHDNIKKLIHISLVVNYSYS